MRVLIVGGAGFIGSTTAHLFREAGHNVVILDNLTTGYARNIPDFKLVEGSMDDSKLLKSIFDAEKIDAVINFAAKIQVGESMLKPAEYYRNNTVEALTLIDEAVKAGIKHFVFSSTGAIYGNQDQHPITEELQPEPINPYTISKHLTEQLLRSYQLTHDLEWVALRYFNVAGSYHHIGQDYPFKAMLIPNLMDALREDTVMNVWGTDYDTPDGTCIRDYIHVADIGRAHVLATEHMVKGLKINGPVNLGTSKGSSVFEVMDAVERHSGKKIKRNNQPRRPGDATRTVASNAKAAKLFGWKPEKNLDDIVVDAITWERKYHTAP